MARTPKAARSSEPATPIEENVPAPDTTTAPKRRGRKPKSMIAAIEPPAALYSDDAAFGSVDADGGIAGPTAAPVRKRPGHKPKQPRGADTAAEVPTIAKAKRGRKPREQVAAPISSPFENGPTRSHTSSQDQATFAVDSGSLDLATEATAGNMAADSPGSNGWASAPSAAQWDRVADVVRFDWTAIERTASQEGPNQVMAKLLVAARAEGANSRWPL